VVLRVRVGRRKAHLRYESFAGSLFLLFDSIGSSKYTSLSVGDVLF